MVGEQAEIGPHAAPEEGDAFRPRADVFVDRAEVAYTGRRIGGRAPPARFAVLRQVKAERPVPLFGGAPRQQGDNPVRLVREVAVHRDDPAVGGGAHRRAGIPSAAPGIVMRSVWSILPPSGGRRFLLLLLARLPVAQEGDPVDKQGDENADERIEDAVEREHIGDEVEPVGDGDAQKDDAGDIGGGGLFDEPR